MQILSRPAALKDVDVLKVLESEAQRSLKEFRGADRFSIEVPEIASKWSEVLNDGSVFVVVGCIDTVAMGYLVARKSGQSKNMFATIERVFVTRDARNLGVGDSLVSATLIWAREQKLTALDGLALPGDRETKNLYERSGLVARLITVTKDLTY